MYTSAVGSTSVREPPPPIRMTDPDRAGPSDDDDGWTPAHDQVVRAGGAHHHSTAGQGTRPMIGTVGHDADPAGHARTRVYAATEHAWSTARRRPSIQT